MLECGKDSKKLFELVSKLTGSKATNPMPEHEDTQQLTEEFSDHFLNKIVRICDALDDSPLYIPPTRIVPELLEFRPMLGEEIKEIIMASPSKFCELDSIPNALLKRLLPVVLLDIISLVNLSLRTGTFANEWKITCVKPLIKSINMQLIKNSYRPISNCNFISKIIENCMLVQLNQHCNLRGLLPCYQSAYQAFHCCETSLLKLCNDMLWQMEYQEVSMLIVCDLSAAFDTINQQTLMEVLSEYYGVKGTALKWFESYLENCKFYISIDEN